MTHTEQMQAAVERDVRFAIGDLHMQVIILRAQLAAVQQEPVMPKGNGPMVQEEEARL